MIMGNCLFTRFTEIERGALGTFVPNSNDWGNSATSAFFLMDHTRFFFLNFLFTFVHFLLNSFGEARNQTFDSLVNKLSHFFFHFFLPMFLPSAVISFLILKFRNFLLSFFLFLHNILHFGSFFNFYFGLFFTNWNFLLLFGFLRLFSLKRFRNFLLLDLNILNINLKMVPG